MAYTTQQVLDFTQRDLMKLTESELRAAVSTLRSTARKRYERIIEAEVQSPALKALWQGVTGDSPFPSVRGMDKGRLQTELMRYKGFLTAKTSTVKGAREYEKKSREAVKDVTGREFSTDEIKRFWDLYESAKDSTIGGMFNYKKVMEVTAEIYDESADTGASNSEIMDAIEKRLQEEYERENPDTSDVSPSQYFRGR